MKGELEGEYLKLYKELENDEWSYISSSEWQYENNHLIQKIDDDLLKTNTNIWEPISPRRDWMLDSDC